MEIRNKQGIIDEGERRIVEGNLSNVERVQYRQDMMDRYRSEIRELQRRKEALINNNNNNNVSSSDNKRRKLRFKF